MFGVSSYRMKWAKVDSLGVVYANLKVLSSRGYWTESIQLLIAVLYVQFLSSFDHSVMHWLISGLNQKFLVTCRRSPSQSAPPFENEARVKEGGVPWNSVCIGQR